MLDCRFIGLLARSRAESLATYFRARQRSRQPGWHHQWTLRNLPVPLPPLEEQRAIADYLDRETARIDTLIEEQQRLIEMLRERRRTAVVDAVTSTPADEVSV